jgi:hypothetical protein
MRTILRVAAVILVTLALSACTTFRNPISDVDIYRVKNTYAAALELAVEYRSYCWARPYAVLMVDPIARPLCERRRPIMRAIQSAQINAGAAIVEANRFVRDNPTITAASAIDAAWTAVTNFKNAVPVVR